MTNVDLLQEVELSPSLLFEHPKQPRPPKPIPPDELPPEPQTPEPETLEPLPPDLFPVPKLPDERRANKLTERR